MSRVGPEIINIILEVTSLVVEAILEEEYIRDIFMWLQHHYKKNSI